MDISFLLWKIRTQHSHIPLPYHPWNSLFSFSFLLDLVAFICLFVVIVVNVVSYSFLTAVY